MITVIVINGKGTSGKDSFIDFFSDVCEKSGYNVDRFSSVHEVKECALKLGWDGVKDDRGRRFLSDLKDALTLYNDLPFASMENRVYQFRELCKDRRGFLFFHIREPQEIKRMVEPFNAVTLLIDRESAETLFSNHADKNVKEYHYDYYVSNNGTLSDLKAEAEEFFKYLMKGVT